jgi:hypothetical protein
MPTIHIEGRTLRVELSTAERIWGLHGSLSIPSEKIVGAQALGKGWWRTLGWRVPGTALPGVIVAGTYIKRGDKAFVSWMRGTELLQINLTGHKYSRVVVGVKDAKGHADAINAALTEC